MRRFLAFLLVVFMCGYAWATDYCQRYPTGTPVVCYTPTNPPPPGGVQAVTASAPLYSSQGSTPNITFTNPGYVMQGDINWNDLSNLIVISNQSGWTASTGKVILTTSSNNVGIGSASPRSVLDVSGNIYDSGLSNGILKASSQLITNAVANTDYMPNPMSALGDIVYGGASGVATRLPIGAAGTVLHGGSTPSYSAVVEGDLSLSAITTGNATTARHGFLPPLSNDSTQYLNGQGNFATPSGVVPSYKSQGFSNATSVTVTHNFGAYPVVDVIDDNGVKIIPSSVSHTSTSVFTVTFFASTSGTIIASVGSPQPQSFIAVSDTYLALTTDRIISCSTAGKVINLPTAVGLTGHEYIIDNASNGNITVTANGAETIEGVVSQIVPSNSSMDIVSNGSAWRIM